ncbi:ribonuclease h1 [Plakobranchus ocellatus]|uniref:Ribonuclease h1 n=1 Tax=Plakobranchus ocellatus TaxID=259542 RepID=A0AAV3YHS7_9GAST|nr:ribonuclease h1 [Plakobranchus ocellatus]
MGRKEETFPIALRALSLETIANYGKEYALAYSDGSSTGGTGNGGYGIYIPWPDGATSRICGPVGEIARSYDCEEAALPGVFIFTDCRALVHAPVRSGRESVGEAVLLAGYLQKTERMRTVVQGLPLRVGVIGNEIAHTLAIQGRTHHNHEGHQHCRFCDMTPPNSGVREVV